MAYNGLSTPPIPNTQQLPLTGIAGDPSRTVAGVLDERARMAKLEALNSAKINVENAANLRAQAIAGNANASSGIADQFNRVINQPNTTQFNPGSTAGNAGLVDDSLRGTGNVLNNGLGAQINQTSVKPTNSFFSSKVNIPFSGGKSFTVPGISSGALKSAGRLGLQAVKAAPVIGSIAEMGNAVYGGLKASDESVNYDDLTAGQQMIRAGQDQSNQGNRLMGGALGTLGTLTGMATSLPIVGDKINSMIKGDSAPNKLPGLSTAKPNAQPNTETTAPQETSVIQSMRDSGSPLIPSDKFVTQRDALMARTARNDNPQAMNISDPSPTSMTRDQQLASIEQSKQDYQNLVDQGRVRSILEMPAGRASKADADFVQGYMAKQAAQIQAQAGLAGHKLSAANAMDIAKLNSQTAIANNTATNTAHLSAEQNKFIQENAKFLAEQAAKKPMNDVEMELKKAQTEAANRKGNYTIMKSADPKTGIETQYMVPIGQDGLPIVNSAKSLSDVSNAKLLEAAKNGKK